MIQEELILKRKEILDKLGGISEPVVKNREWLYLLQEETRNSIMIEGVFLNKTELKEVLDKSKGMTRNETQAYNYFVTAKFIYGLGFQNFKENSFFLNIPIIRQINKELGYKGEFRKGSVKITGANFTPPTDYIKEYLLTFIEFVNWLFKFKGEGFFEKLSVAHAFFEEIHPFEDGNGRTGRILLNYILISKGFPLIIIKGEEKAKEKYYKGLEEIDKSNKKIFEKTEIPNTDKILEILINTQSDTLNKMLTSSLRESLDRLIIERLREKGEKLIPVSTLLAKRNYGAQTYRKLIERGKIIALKEKNKWLSTESIVDKFL